MRSKMIQNAVKLYYYTKREGPAAVIRRCIKVIFPVDATYEKWKVRHKVSKYTLSCQRRESKNWSITIGIILLQKDNNYSLLKKSLEKQSAQIADIRSDLRNGKDDFILLAGSDIYLSENALYEFGDYILKHPETDWFYCDHDVDGKTPLFKPDFNYNYLLSCPYIGDVVVVRRTVLEKLLLKDARILSGNIYRVQLELGDLSNTPGHIAKVLYHSQECSQRLENKQQLMEYLSKKKVPCKVNGGQAEGTYDVCYHMDVQPLVSVIIPNRNHMEDLKKCLMSLEEQDYKNFEIIIAENHSDQPGIFNFYKDIEKKWNHVKILQWKQPFNYSAINNFAAKHASGEYLLFLNNDVEFILKQSVSRMVQLMNQKQTGAVGIKLLYPDGTIQHAGVIVGYGGIAGHAFCGCSGTDSGYMNRINCVQNYSAVTAACMLVRREAFTQCNGFDEAFQIAFNDIDFCLRLRQMGYHIVYTPYALAWHYESKSRGTEDSLRKMQRFNREVSLFCKRWKSVIKHGDEAYNPNLSLDKWDFSIKV